METPMLVLICNGYNICVNNMTFFCYFLWTRMCICFVFVTSSVSPSSLQYWLMIYAEVNHWSCSYRWGNSMFSFCLFFLFCFFLKTNQAYLIFCLFSHSFHFFFFLPNRGNISFCLYNQSNWSWACFLWIREEWGVVVDKMRLKWSFEHSKQEYWIPFLSVSNV